MSKPDRIVVALTGASGVPYARSLLAALGRAGLEVHVTISSGFFEVVKAESEFLLNEESVDLRAWTTVDGDFHYHHFSRIGAPIASGSFRTRGMIVAPCSISTLSCIASGTGKTLIERSADVILKEGRKLALVLRESPLSAISLENALKLARIGVHIVPACPAFYTKPKTIDDVVDFTVARTLDLFDVEHDLSKRWGER